LAPTESPRAKPAPVVPAPDAPRATDDVRSPKPAASAEAEVKFKDWGPLAAAVANPQFLEAWGASRRQPAPGDGGMPGAAEDSPPSVRRSSRKWLWVALALFLFVATGCAVGLAYFGGWLHRWNVHA
jgi:hypothetical protein